MMPQRPRVPKRSAIAAAGVLVAAVLLRSWFLLAFDESYFDSDQAIVGLMAKHLLERRALPLFFYGQEYMLAVEAWLMVPLFAALGPTVFALRLTIVLLNCVAALTLWWLLVRDARMHLWLAVVAVLPFALAPVITSAHLSEAQGGNIEPFLWVLIAWMVRERPIALGVVSGMAFLNREFTVYALPALFLVQLVQAGREFAPLLRRWAMTAVAFVVVFQAVNALKPHADLLGPGSAGVAVSPGRQDNVSLLLERTNVNAAALPARFRTLATEYLPLLTGLNDFRPNLISIGSDAHVGWRELAMPVAIVLSVLLAWLMVEMLWQRKVDAAAFPIFLLIVGGEAALVYALTRDLSIFTFRYGLLAAFLPVAVAALALQNSRPVLMRSIAGVLFGVLAGAALIDHVTVLQRAAVAPPPPRLAPIADRLVARGVRLARSDYWRAYAITFLAGERVKVASRDLQRILEYQVLADTSGSGVVIVQPTPCDGQRPFDVVGDWHLCQ
jgi:hypothetical protein